jgi:hypothetical protein
MVLTDPESSPSDRGSPMPEGGTMRPSPLSPSLPSTGYGRPLVFALAAGLIAGVGSWLAGEFIVGAYQSELNPALKARPSAEDMQRLRDARLYSATLTFTAMGGFLGLAMGLAGGLAQRSATASARAAILGLVLGTPAAASAALVILPIFFKRHDPQTGDLVLPLFTHGGIWSTIGVVGGLAFGLGLGGRGKWKATLVGGLVGAAAATIVYEIVGAVAFASNKTELPLSSAITTRAMAQLLVAVLSAVGAVLALRQSANREASSSVSN